MEGHAGAGNMCRGGLLHREYRGCKGLSLTRRPGAPCGGWVTASLPYDPRADVKVCSGAVAPEKSHLVLTQVTHVKLSSEEMFA